MKYFKNVIEFSFSMDFKQPASDNGFVSTENKTRTPSRSKIFVIADSDSDDSDQFDDVRYYNINSAFSD